MARFKAHDLPDHMQAQIAKQMTDQGKPERKAAQPSEAEETLALQMRVDQLPPFEREYRFSGARRWRFDFAWPELKLAVEVEGITHQHGRHQRKDGFEKDLEKYEAALLDGWDVYRCSQSMVKSGRAIDTIKTLLAMKKEVMKC